MVNYTEVAVCYGFSSSDFSYHCKFTLDLFFFLSVNWNIALVVLYVYNPDDEVIHSPRALIVQCCFCLE